MKSATTFFMVALFMVILHPFSLSGQNFPIDEETGKITFTEVVNLENESIMKAELYSRARVWFASGFKSANDVLQMDDKELGKLIGKGNFVMKSSYWLKPSFVGFTISIFVKDGRYKYTITDLFHESYESGYSGGALEDAKPDCGGFNMVKSAWLDVKTQTSKLIVQTISELKVAMENSSETSDDEWLP